MPSCAPGVVTALTRNDSRVTTQDSGEETKEEGKEDEIVILEEAVDAVEWDDRPARTYLKNLLSTACGVAVSF